MNTHIIPLFPLGTVLFPELPMPLHIFEERYKQMIADCLATETEFGIVWFEGGNIHRVGCSARVVKVLQTYDDGKMDILTKGVRRFHIESVIDERQYLQAKVSFFEDEPEEDVFSINKLVTHSLALLREIAELRDQEIDIDELSEMSPELISFMISGGAGFKESEEQILLEMTSTGKRLEKIVASLSKVFERIKLDKEIQQIIRKNGFVPQSVRDARKDAE